MFAWLMYKDPSSDLETLNAWLRQKRDVRKTLWKQSNIIKLHSRMQQKETVLLDIVEEKIAKQPPIHEDEPEADSEEQEL